MSTVRDARRALTRGDVDAALVDLWNSLEPLRLNGDVSGLRTAAQLAKEIAEHGDGSQSREALRLLAAVHDTLDPEAAAAATAVRVTPAAVAPAPARAPADDEASSGEWDVEPVPDDVDELDDDVDERTARPRIGGLIWALIIAAFLIFNVVRGLLQE